MEYNKIIKEIIENPANLIIGSDKVLLISMGKKAESDNKKAIKWDKLDEEIGKIYEDSSDQQDLVDVGVAAAEAFDYL